METKSLTKAFMDFFGKKQGQTTGEFAAEMKAAKEADLQGWVRLFAEVGIKAEA